MEKNKMEILNNLTDLEKEVLIGIFYEGYALDDLDGSNFMTWSGETGKKERGALGSLCKKGVLEKTDFKGKDDDFIVVGEGFTKREIAAAVGYEL